MTLPLQWIILKMLFPKFSMSIREIYNQTRDVLKNSRKFVKMGEKEN